MSIDIPPPNASAPSELTTSSNGNNLPAKIATDVANAENMLKSGDWQGYIAAMQTLNADYKNLGATTQQSIQASLPGFPSSQLPTIDQIEQLQTYANNANLDLSSVMQGGDVLTYQKSLEALQQEVQDISRNLPANIQSSLAAATSLPSPEAIENYFIAQDSLVDSLNQLTQHPSTNTTNYNQALTSFAQIADSLFQSLPTNLQKDIPNPAQSFPSASSLQELFSNPSNPNLSSLFQGLISGLPGYIQGQISSPQTPSPTPPPAPAPAPTPPPPAPAPTPSPTPAPAPTPPPPAPAPAPSPTPAPAPAPAPAPTPNPNPWDPYSSGYDPLEPWNYEDLSADNPMEDVNPNNSFQ